ncbi:MAG: WD40 repeat domain-containing protein, partial [Cyanobacteria bacterium P01_D01_bin.73]
KKMLMSQSLDEVVEDCGPKQSKLAWLVLGLLTSENSIRPLKTRIELEQDLIQLGYFSEEELEAGHHESHEELELVLDILVASGLVFFIPDEPVHCYQLVHDYLVQLIRDRQGSAIERLRDNLSRERLLRRRKELQLTRVLKQRLRWAIATGITLCGLFGFSSYIAYLNWREAANERYLANSLQVENQAQQASASAIAPQPTRLNDGRFPTPTPETSPSGLVPEVLAGDNKPGVDPNEPPPMPESGDRSVPSRDALLKNLSELLTKAPFNPNPSLAAQIDVTHGATLAQLLDPLVVRSRVVGGFRTSSVAPIQDLAWQPGGDRFGLIDYTGSAQIYDRDGKLLHRLDSLNRGRSLQLLWHPNGRTLMTRHSSGVVTLWDQDGNWQVSFRLPALITSNTAIAWAWSGQHLAIAHPRRPRLWIWDTTKLGQSTSPKNTLQLPAIARSLAWQPVRNAAKNNVPRLAIGLANGTIALTTDQQNLDSELWPAGDQPITAMAWKPVKSGDRPQSHRLVSIGATIILWDGKGKAVHISDWPAAFPRTVLREESGLTSRRALSRQILQWQPQGNLLTLLTSPSSDRPQGVGVWQLDSSGNKLNWIRSLDYSQGLFSAMAWRSDGSMLLTGDRTGIVRRWPLRRSTQKQLLCAETDHCPELP